MTIFHKTKGVRMSILLLAGSVFLAACVLKIYPNGNHGDNGGDNNVDIIGKYAIEVKVASSIKDIKTIESAETLYYSDYADVFEQFAAVLVEVKDPNTGELMSNSVVEIESLEADLAYVRSAQAATGSTSSKEQSYPMIVNLLDGSNGKGYAGLNSGVDNTHFMNLNLKNIKISIDGKMLSLEDKTFLVGYTDASTWDHPNGDGPSLTYFFHGRPLYALFNNVKDRRVYIPAKSLAIGDTIGIVALQSESGGLDDFQVEDVVPYIQGTGALSKGTMRRVPATDFDNPMFKDSPVVYFTVTKEFQEDEEIDFVFKKEGFKERIMRVRTIPDVSLVRRELLVTPGDSIDDLDYFGASASLNIRATEEGGFIKWRFLAQPDIGWVAIKDTILKMYDVRFEDQGAPSNVQIEKRAFVHAYPSGHDFQVMFHYPSSEPVQLPDKGDRLIFEKKQNHQAPGGLDQSSYDSLPDQFVFTIKPFPRG